MSAAKLPPKSSPKPASKPGKDTVYVDVDDEITAIIDKVENAKQKIVALVLPKRAAMLQSIVNMRLLKRSAGSAGKNVVLITSESALLPLAGAAGLHVAKNLQSKPEIPNAPHAHLAGAASKESEAEDIPEDGSEELDDQPQKLDYDKPIGELAGVNEPESIALGDEEDDEKLKAAAGAAAVSKKASKSKNKGLKVPNFDKFRLLVIGGGAALLGLIIFIILAIGVLPHAKITIQTTSTPVSLSSTLTASGAAKELDEAKKIIPSELKTSDQISNQQVQATGQQNNGEKASGSIALSLKDCSQDQVTIPAGSGASSNGLTFITQSSVTLSSVKIGGNCKNNTADASKTVNVIAQSAGAKYNLTSGSSFTVAGYSNISGSSSGSMSGGTDNNVTILQQQDIDGAKAKITSADSDKFSKDFQKQLSDGGYYVISSTLKIGDPAVTSTPNVGQPTSNASVNIKITYSVLVVKKGLLEKAVKDALTKEIDQKKERLSDDDVLKDLTLTVQNQKPDSPDATLLISKDTAAVPIIDIAAVKEQAKGKKESQIKSYINTYPGVKNIDVKMSPFWVSSAPKKTSKITVIQQQVKTDQKNGQ